VWKPGTWRARRVSIAAFQAHAPSGPRRSAHRTRSAPSASNTAAGRARRRGRAGRSARRPSRPRPRRCATRRRRRPGRAAGRRRPRRPGPRCAAVRSRARGRCPRAGWRRPRCRGRSRPRSGGSGRAGRSRPRRPGTGGLDVAGHLDPGGLLELGDRGPGQRSSGRLPAGPHRSPKAAPASTEASWSRSPSSTSRASGRIASTSLAISGSETIEASSTMTTSCGSGRPPRVTEPAARVPAGAEQPVQGRRRRVFQRVPDGVVEVEGGQPLAQRVLQACRRLPGRCGERDAQGPVRVPGERLDVEQREDAGDGVGLARCPGPPAMTVSRRSTATAAASRCRSSRSPPSPTGPNSSRAPPERVAVDLVDALRRTADQRGGQLLLVAPVAVEVEPVPVEDERGRPGLRTRGRDGRRRAPPPGGPGPATAARRGSSGSASCGRVGPGCGSTATRSATRSSSTQTWP
jgi:hypothetical protein